MANKYLKYDVTTGDSKQEEFTVVSTGIADAGKGIATDSTGKIDASMMPAGIVAEVIDAVCTEAIGAGDYIDVWNDAGVSKIRLADNTNGRKAKAYCLVAYNVGETARGYFEGENTAKSSLIPGKECFLDQAGDITQVPPTPTAGHFVQCVGFAKNATTISTDIEKKVIWF